jgi:hypothetical protein
MASTLIPVPRVDRLLINADKPPPAYLYESDIVMNDAPNPRLVESDKRLLKASRELLHALRLYSSSRGGDVAGFVGLPDEPNTSSSVEDVREPEKLSILVDKILAEQTNQKASISSRFWICHKQAIPPSVSHSRHWVRDSGRSHFRPRKGSCQRTFSSSRHRRSRAHQEHGLPQATRPNLIPGSPRCGSEESRRGHKRLPAFSPTEKLPHTTQGMVGRRRCMARARLRTSQQLR